MNTELEEKELVNGGKAAIFKIMKNYKLRDTYLAKGKNFESNPTYTPQNFLSVKKRKMLGFFRSSLRKKAAQRNLLYKNRNRKLEVKLNKESRLNIIKTGNLMKHRASYERQMRSFFEICDGEAAADLDFIFLPSLSVDVRNLGKKAKGKENLLKLLKDKQSTISNR